MPLPLAEHHERKAVNLILIITIGVLLLGTIYLFIQTRKQDNALSALTKERDLLSAENASTTRLMETEREEASSTIAELSERLSLTAEDLAEIENDLRRERDKNSEFEDQINDLAGTVGVLDKLSKTDKELLQKYSRTYFLNENFMPLKLSLIPKSYLMNPNKDAYFHGDALKFLEDMLDAASRAGFDVKIISAFRSFDEQKAVKSSFTVVYGSGANAFSADQGYSEHQLGTTVDIVDTVTKTTSDSFADTEAYAWLVKNAYKYGFILSYPKGNNFYIYEPWHWRFVGRSLAKDLHNEDKTFYELDQRELDKYLIKIFD